MRTIPAVLLVAFGRAALQTASVRTATEQTLTGEYRWEQTGRSGAVRSVFTPTRDGTWEVAF